MKILKWVVGFLIFLILIGGVLLVSQRVLLYVATQQLAQALKELKQIATQQLYHSQCREMSQLYGVGLTKTQFQLRFVSDREYVFEAVCPIAENKPILISTHQLPQGVSKKPGSSGFIIGAQFGQVELVSGQQILSIIGQYFPKMATVFEKSDRVSLTDDQVATGSQLAFSVIEPITTCEGYGYSCCTGFTQAGLGERKTASDCSERCYPTCQDLPTILSFTAFPNFESAARTVTIKNGEQIDFWVVASNDQTTLTIDFGDGENKDQSLLSQPVSHQFWCQKSECSYTVTATLKDNQGNSSLVSPTSQIIVIISS